MADTVAAEFDKLHSEIGQKTKVLDGLEALFHGICARLKGAIRQGMAAAASDAQLAPFQDLLHALQERGPNLSAAVMANTPHRDEAPAQDSSGPARQDHHQAVSDGSPEEHGAYRVPAGVSTADDTPHPDAVHSAEVPFADRVKAPILPTVGSNYVQAPMPPAGVGPVVEDVQPFPEGAPGPAEQNHTPVEPPSAEEMEERQRHARMRYRGVMEHDGEEGQPSAASAHGETAPEKAAASVESEPSGDAPANAAQAHDRHEAQAEKNTSEHANDHDAKRDYDGKKHD